MSHLLKQFGLLVVYAAVICTCILVIFYDAENANTQGKFTEGSLTEMFQVIFLGLMVIATLILTKNRLSQRAFFALLATLLTMAFIREFDSFLDENVFDGAWQMLVFGVLAAGLLFAYKHKTGMIDQIQKGIQSRGFGAFMAGMLTTFLFSRLFGKTTLWEAIMEDQYLRWAKNAAEECTELLGYGLMLIGVLDILLNGMRLSKDRP